jgi:cobalt-zinc-cadmium efflux system membrane fusion protein
VPLTTLFAEVVAGPEDVHALGPGVDGRILSWKVRSGDEVQRGDALAVLNSPALSDLVAEVGLTRGQLEQATQSLERERAQLEAGLLSGVELATTQSEVTRLQASLADQERRLRAHRDGVAQSGGAWIWRAPVAGEVGEIRCSVGLVQADERCLTLRTSQSTALLRVQLPERYLADAQGPLMAEAVLDGGEQVRFEELSRVTSLDAATRSQALTFIAPTWSGLPGRSGRATLWSPQDASSLPEEALTLIDGEWSVFIQGPEGPEPLSVRPLGRDGDQVYVSSMEPELQVAIDGLFLLKSLYLSEGL